MSLPRLPLTPCWGEIGRNGDWKSHALVERIGISNDGETELYQHLNRSHFELRHKSGLKMRVNIEPLLDEAAEALRLEAIEREAAANVQS